MNMRDYLLLFALILAIVGSARYGIPYFERRAKRKAAAAPTDPAARS